MLARAVSRAQPAAAARFHTSSWAPGYLTKVRQVLNESRPAKAKLAKESQSGSSKEQQQQQQQQQQQEHQRWQQKSKLQQQQVAHAAGHQFQPAMKAADPMVAMPKVFGKIEQPVDAEVGKFVIIGAANAGKSTLINRLTNSRVSIVSARPQTTRTRIMASTTVDNRQLLFLDTPGVVSRQALRRVSRSVVTSPWTTIAEADYLIVLLDAFKLTEKTDAVEKYLFAQLGTNSKTPAILVVNKIDLVQDNDKLGEKVREYMAQYSHFVAGPVFISALGDTNVEELKQILLASTKAGDWLVPADVSSDMSDLMRVEELIRAEWFARLEGHLPYVVKQRNVGWEEVPIPPKYVAGEGEPAAVERKALVISQELVVSSKGEAKILTGAGGSVILGISRSANVNISKALGRPVRLHLQVIVEEDTRRRK
ncbi:P-loop containing nucleoside triphosphate hydrolase protein [Linderina pennispora]|uniref:p-loop containing nucleoside triphosphate hydrolase protein n=1 Tax=Linderina pennispora TaxID=61395 RepID=A0A1Y1W4T7_9FUNG|nr:P-loop containing nucleoside triphosphate hydrolase protein [Linderina pennispora]ORX68539.1 P-loop containing nucleoside triphosphate hydrolase protein [Linderina pennispora]